MRLEDIEKELYHEEGPKAKEKAPPPPSAPPAWQEFPTKTPTPRAPGRSGPRFALPRIPRWFWWSASALIITVSIGFVLWWWFFSFPKAQVLMRVEGPGEVRLGERHEIRIHYENKTRVALENARLVFALPENVVLAGDPGLRRIERTLGTIGIGGRGEEQVTVRFLGSSGEAVELSPTLIFRPQNLSSSLERSETVRVHLGPPALKVEFSLPNEVLSGERFWANLRYENNAQEAMENLRVRAELPTSYRIIRVVPTQLGTTPDWSVGPLASGESGEITLEGVVEGEERQENLFEVKIGILERGSFLTVSQVSSKVVIAPSPLLIAASVNDAKTIPAFPGDELRFKITFKNNTTVSLREIVVKTELLGEMLDRSSLRPGTAFFDSRASTLVWHGGNTPQLLALNPGESGEVEFSARLLPNYQLSSTSRRELTVVLRATISSSNIPALLGVQELSGKSELSIPVVSRVLLRQKITFRGGAKPMRVGAASTFQVSWTPVTFSNDISDLTIRTVLPEGVTWSGGVTGNFEEFGAPAPQFNERTGELTWILPRLPAGSGVTQDGPTASFDITAQPSGQHINRPMVLMNEISSDGQDTFAAISVSSRLEPADSTLPDDPTWNPKDGEVRP